MKKPSSLISVMSTNYYYYSNNAAAVDDDALTWLQVRTADTCTVTPRV